MAKRDRQQQQHGTADADAPTLAIRGGRAGTAPAVDPRDRTLTSPHVDPRGTAFGPGDRIHRYQLTSLLGVGGMGVVYAAHDTELHRPVAIKVLHQGGDEAANRALREARVLAQFRHANVVPLFDVGVHQGQVYLVMPLLEEGTLGRWLRAARRPWRAIVRKFALAARGLQAAHAIGLVHRDFKPDNVLLGADDEVRVSDFGLVSAGGDIATFGAAIEDAGAGSTHTRIRGTPTYMAPEQLDDTHVDARADQFSFCVALHAALYGQRPFAETDATPIDLGALRAAIRAGRVRPPPRDRRVPRWLAASIARGLRDDPADRWPSMAALVDSFECGARRSRWRRVAIVLSLAALIGVAVLIAMRVGAPRSRPPVAPGSVQLTRLGEIDAAALSPDGTLIAVHSRAKLRLVPSAGGDERVVHRSNPDVSRPGATPTQHHIAWSPDGKRLLTHRFDSKDTDQARYLLVDVTTSRVIELGHVRGRWGTLLPNDEIVSAERAGRKLFFASIDPRVPTRACDLPGAYQAINGLRAIGPTIYVNIRYPEGYKGRQWPFNEWLATDRRCTKPRSICEDGAPSSRGCVLLSGVATRYLLGVGRGRPLVHVPADAESVVGVRADGAVVLTTRTDTWRLWDLSLAPLRDLLAGAGLAPHLALAPDRRRLAITEPTRGSAPKTRILSIDALDEHPPAIAYRVYGGAGWSPDGTTLAVKYYSAIELIDLATMARRRIVFDDPQISGDLIWLDDHRIAFPRTDRRTYRWIDTDDGTTGELLDATKGATARLASSPFDGALAVIWDRPDGRGIWVIPPGGEPTPVASTLTHRFAWSVDGQTLWIAGLDQRGSYRLEQYDPRTQVRRNVRTFDLPSTTALVGLMPMGGDRVLLQTQDTVVDLVRVDP